jgi:hypothetical protein
MKTMQHTFIIYQTYVQQAAFSERRYTACGFFEGQDDNEDIRRRCGMVDVAENMREARLRWYECVIRRDEGEPVRDIVE